MKEKIRLKNNVLVFASGDAEGGGSGFQEMVEQSRTVPPILGAEIVGVVSNHIQGGVCKKAEDLGIPFEHWNGPFTGKKYQSFVKKYKADFVMCSGWLKPVEGLDPARTVNIHPGPLNCENNSLHFGGKGYYGHHVHEAVMKSYRMGTVRQSAVTMHFVTPYSVDEYDRGPIFFQLPVLIRPDDTPKTLAARVNEKERAWQSKILNLVVQGTVKLFDGKVIYSTPDIRRICLGR